jgi:hypothetical protein
MLKWQICSKSYVKCEHIYIHGAFIVSTCGVRCITQLSSNRAFHVHICRIQANLLHLKSGVKDMGIVYNNWFLTLFKISTKWRFCSVVDKLFINDFLENSSEAMWNDRGMSVPPFANVYYFMHQCWFGICLANM